MKRRLTFLITLALTALFAHAASAAASDDFDRWFVLELQGQRAGHAHMTATTEGDVIITTQEMHIAVRRGPITVTIEQSHRFQETLDGKPIEADVMMKMGAMAMNSHYRFTDQGIELTAEQGGRQQTSTLPPIQGDWLPPAAAQRHVAAKLEQGAETITLRTIDLSMGVQPIHTTMTLLGEQNVEVFGRTVPAIAWEAAVSSMPGLTMREYVDHAGRTLKSTIALGGGMEFTLLAADEQLAKAQLDPPEVVASLLIRPAPGSVPMSAPRTLRAAVYEIAVEPGPAAEGFDLARTGYQRVLWGDRETARVIVDLDHPVNPLDDLPTDAHLASSMMLNHEDPKIRELVAEALEAAEPDASTPQKAEALRAFVHDYLTEKSLGVGFATASETARTREGDCTEHAVLLAAMLRAASIPSRVATGLVYVDEFIGEREVFGGHMWTQAWLASDTQGGRWVDLDPTLADHPFDAAHITISVAALSDGDVGNELVKMVPLLSSMTIKVITAQ